MVSDAALLSLLSTDKSFRIQRSVAEHKNCPREILLMLSKSGEWRAKEIALDRLEKDTQY